MGLVYAMTVVKALLLDALFFRFRLAQHGPTGLGMQSWLVLIASIA